MPQKTKSPLSSQNVFTSSLFGFRTAWRSSAALTTCSLGLLVVVSLLPGLQVVLIARLVDSVSTGDSGALTTGMIGVALCVAATEPLAQAVRALGYQIVSRARADLHGDLAHAVAAMPPSMLRRPETVDRVQSVKDAISMQTGYLYLNVLLALQGIIGAIGVCLAVFTFNVLSGLLVLLAALPVYLASSYLNRVQDRMDAPLAALSRRAGYLETLITHQRSATELNSLGTGQRVAAWTAAQYHTVADFESRLLRPLLKAQILAGVVTGALIAAALLVLVTEQATAGAAAGVVAAVAGAGAIRSAGFSLGSLAEASPRVGRHLQLLEDAPEPAPQSEAPAVHKIEAVDLRFSYDEVSPPALDGVSLSARRGEMVALVGPNGAGKTTAVNCLIGALDPSSGGVFINGQNAAQLEEAERLAVFGALSQEFGRFELRVRDAVGLGQPARALSDDDLADALTKAQAADVVAAMKSGLDTQLGDQWEGGVGISGGQWQRMALARIYARNAPVWILDEPTSAIDAEAEYEVFARLHRTRADRITIVVSHRAWTLQAMDRIYVLDNGSIVESGTFDELVAAGGRFTALFRSQMATSTSD
ncbi:ATP-binding cassette domain-containing protein [Kribbella italica]|uniref:ATP-binding cassette subfamily B protein n=1 Tax=Kribbella italica TaxID=1540520 RepID=A0A7W9MZP1_9ACTN|nr:ABC transporter ATP-binding protein [Kribbella italica]MBB5841443.1 ATP-binding cassette subfamily B protein [Kribbella italica]